MRAKRNIWAERIVEFQDRLKDVSSWYPFCSLISVGLVVVLIGKLFPGLNPRQGNLANIITFPAKLEKEGHIWFSLYPENNQLVIQTADRHRIIWPLDNIESKNVRELSQYLVGVAQKEAIATGRTLSTNYVKTSAVIAIDQRLQFKHIRPVLAALAEAKISKYGFETRMTRNVSH